MRESGVYGKYKRKYKTTTISKPRDLFAPNLLKQNFKVAGMNVAWVSDITYIWTKESWLYLAVVIDLFSRKIVGWTLSERMTKELVMDAFLKAYWKRKPSKGLIFHSDRGSQYTAKSFTTTLSNLGATSSMSAKGNCYDNAVAESFFHTMKNEIHGNAQNSTRNTSLTFNTRAEARLAIFEYIEVFYNPKRRHSYLQYHSPDKFETIALAEPNIQEPQKPNTIAS